MTEKIIHACVIHPSGEKLCWPSHTEAMEIASRHGVKFKEEDILQDKLQKGFITDSGRFVTMEEAWEIAYNAGQTKEKYNKLFSYLINL